eukprot:2700546-Amphidinium_carterae.3
MDGIICTDKASQQPSLFRGQQICLHFYGNSQNGTLLRYCGIPQVCKGDGAKRLSNSKDLTLGDLTMKSSRDQRVQFPMCYALDAAAAPPEGKISHQAQ